MRIDWRMEHFDYHTSWPIYAILSKLFLTILNQTHHRAFVLKFHSTEKTRQSWVHEAQRFSMWSTACIPSFRYFSASRCLGWPWPLNTVHPTGQVVPKSLESSTNTYVVDKGFAVGITIQQILFSPNNMSHPQILCGFLMIVRVLSGLLSNRPDSYEIQSMYCFVWYWLFGTNLQYLRRYKDFHLIYNIQQYTPQVMEQKKLRKQSSIQY